MSGHDDKKVKDEAMIKNSRCLPAQGFTLVEIAIVLAIIGLALGMFLPISTAMKDTQSRQLTKTKLEVIDTALANFVAQNKYLPCPALGTTASGAANAGVEQRVVATGTCNPATQANGVVPWVTLGITENDASDAWLQRITYRVDPALASNTVPLMNMSSCDPIGTGPAIAIGASFSCAAPVSGCITTPLNCTSPANFLTDNLAGGARGKGLDVWDGVTLYASRQNNRALGTGAAYVLISHGPTGTAAYNSSGSLTTGTVAAGTNEVPNQNNQALPVFPPGAALTFRDAQLSDATTAAHFDDYLSHPTIMSVLNKANLGPRAN